MDLQGGSKSKPLSNDQKIELHHIKPVDEIRFINQIKVRF